jgi:integrase
MASPRHAHVQFTKPDLVLAEAERLKFKNARLALSTTLSYERDWRVFTAWCQAAQLWCLPATTETVELYSLRAGLATAALENGCDSLVVARHTGHASLDMLRRYYRSIDLWRGNPGGRIGL